MSEESKLISGRKRVKIELVAVAKIFMLACIVGATSIILGVLFNSSILAVGMPLGTMAAYIVVMLRNDNDLPMSIVGDSFYYLGFILTLVALVSSLVSLAANDNVNMNSVVGSFGAALTTTIVGLIARLVVTSFSVQAKERRERLENEIEKSLTTFSAQLDILTTHVVASISKVHAETESALSENLKRYKQVHKELADEYQSSMSAGLDSVQSAVIGVASRIEAIDVSQDIVSKPLNTSLEGITETLVQHQKNYEKVNQQLVASNNNLSAQFEKTGTLIQAHVNQLDSALSNSISEHASEYKESLGAIGDAIITSLGDIKDLKLEAQDAVSEQLKQLSTEMAEVVNGVRNIKAPLKSSIDELSKGGDEIANSMQKLADTARRIENVVQEVGASASQSTDIRSELEKLTLSLAEVKKQIDDVGEAGRGAAERMTAAASATEHSSSQVAKDISEVYQQLALQIRALKGVS